MKELKFRAWDKEQEEMIKVTQIIFPTNFNPGYAGDFKRDGDNVLLPFDANVILMQYTGLKDSELKDEYFGDVIQELDGTKRTIEDGNSAVLFINTANKNDIKYFWQLLPHTIIGDIYSNPELLKGGS